MLTSGPKDHVGQSIWSVMSRGTSAAEGNGPNTSDGTNTNIRRRFERLSKALDSFRPFKGMEKRLEKRSMADSQSPDSQQVTKPAQGLAKKEDDAINYQ